MKQKIKLPSHVIKHIGNYIYPTEEQLEYWRMDHYLNYYKVLKDVEDTIMEVKIGTNGRMKVVFSLFSLSILYEELESSYSDEEDEVLEFYNYNYGFEYLE